MLQLYCTRKDFVHSNFNNKLFKYKHVKFSSQWNRLTKKSYTGLKLNKRIKKTVLQN